MRLFDILSRGMSSVLLMLFALLICPHRASAVEYRTINGAGNNLTNPSWGQAGTPLVRMGEVTVDRLPGFDASLLAPAYEDGLNTPRGMTTFNVTTGLGTSRLPNPREVSNAVVAQGKSSRPNSQGASDWLWQWGQFIDHDFSLEEPTPTSDPFGIPVLDTNDSLYNSHYPFIPFRRNDAAAGTGVGTTPREQTNALTAYIDGSNVYGSDQARADFLRTFAGGMLKTSTGNNGEVLLPTNRSANPFPNANPPVRPGDTPPAADQLFLAGDVRANEQLGLTAVHTLFVREHNRLASQLSQRTDLATLVTSAGFNPANASEVDEYLYQTSRQAVGAQIQRITYEEFLPLLVGHDALSPYAGYDATVNATLSNEFANAAYRVGHTLLSPVMTMAMPDGTPMGDMPLRDAFFNPEYTKDHGVDMFLKGLTMQSAQSVDALIVDEVREFLFAEGNGGLDLAAVNLQRGRDHGLPSYNDMRRGLGLTARTDFNQVTSDTDVATAMAEVYKSIEDLDLWLGAVAEDPLSGSMIGELLTAILGDQFTRTRDGDRFFYENQPDAFALFPELADSTLASVIMRNSAIERMGSNAFLAVPEPTGLALALLSLTLATRRAREG